jgi:hypothetical protein
MPDPNTYTPDWRVDVEPEQADDYYYSSDADSSDNSDQIDDSESE